MEIAFSFEIFQGHQHKTFLALHNDRKISRQTFYLQLWISRALSVAVIKQLCNDNVLIGSIRLSSIALDNQHFSLYSENLTFLRNFLCRSRRILRRNVGCVLSNSRREQTQVATRRWIDRIEPRTWFPSNAPRVER